MLKLDKMVSWICIIRLILVIEKDRVENTDKYINNMTIAVNFGGKLVLVC